MSNVDHKLLWQTATSVSFNTSVFCALVVVVVKFLGNDPLPSAAFNSDFTKSSVWCLLFLCLHVSVCLLHVSFALQAGCNFHTINHTNVAFWIPPLLLFVVKYNQPRVLGVVAFLTARSACRRCDWLEDAGSDLVSRQI